MSAWSELRSEFTVPIYDEQVVVVVTTDTHASLCKIDPEQYADVYLGACVLWPRVAGTYYLIVDVNDVADMAIVGHEAFHLTVRIAHRNSIKFDIDNHEAYAFLQGFILREVCSRLQDLANQLPKA